MDDIVHYRRTIIGITSGVMLLLVLLLGLGLRQYALASRHQEMVHQVEKLTFQFAMLREHILEMLLSGQTGKLASVTPELEELGLRAKQLVQSSEQFRHAIDVAKSFDLASLILLLKGMPEPAPALQALQINRELRDLAERLLLLDRFLVHESRQRLILLQHSIIGILALITSALLFFLLRLYRRTFAPLALLVAESEQVCSEAALELKVSWPDPLLQRLAQTLRHCGEQIRQERGARQTWQRTLDAVGHARAHLAQEGPKEKILQHCCRSLLENPDTCLAWIGLPDPQGQDVIPITADASTSMTREECAGCMAVLLTAAEENGMESNPAARALHSGEPVVQGDILAGTPRGLIKNTPLADGQAACAAFPLRQRGSNLGVLSLYARHSSAFADPELQLVMGLADSIALRMLLWQEEEALALCQGLLAHVVEHSAQFLALLDMRGVIVEEGATLTRLACNNAQSMRCRHWSACFRPAQKETMAELPLGSSSPPPQTALTLSLIGSRDEQRWHCRLIPLKNRDGAILHYGLWGEQQQRATLEAPSAQLECASMLPILGRLTASCAHDIRDLASGIINYAQLGQDTCPQQEDIFNKILKGGERLADLARALVFYGQQEESVEEFLPLSQILADAIRLLSPLCHGDHIRLDLSQQDDLSHLQLPGRPLQQLVCTLLLRGRRALNSRYPGADGRKRLHVQARALRDDREEYAEITFTDWGSGAGEPGEAVAAGAGDDTLPQDASTPLLERCRQLASKLGGFLRVATQSASTSIVVTLPLRAASDRLPPAMEEQES